MTERGIDCSGLVHMASARPGGSCRATPTSRRRPAPPVATSRSPATSSPTATSPHDHIAFWLGDGRILHSTQRDGANGVVEEPEPDELRTPATPLSGSERVRHGSN